MSVTPPILEEAPVARRGRAVATLLSEGKFDDVAKSFDTTMAGALPVAKLAETWNGIVLSAGPFKEIEGVQVVESGAYRTAVVTCLFGTTRLDLKLAFDKDQKIAGFFVTQSPAPWTNPAYADASKFSEKDVVVNPGPWQLPGTLTLPSGAGPFPAVILVHGSGPGDRDESVGANRPFKDLAVGLASRGIAVLRYEKRTKEHGKKIDIQTFKMDDESIDDAVAAFDLLSKDASIDPARVYVAGHSLGGAFAPRIGEKAPKLAGIALLAGSTRSVPDMMIEQIEYLSSLDGKKSPEEEKQLEPIRAAQKRIRELEKGAAPKPGEVVLGAAATYWVEFAKYDPVATAKKLTMPIFVAQGGRDYQVTDVDYKAWQTGLRGKKNAVFHRYEKANHLFILGEGKPSPEEYQRTGHVDVALVDDLAKWITGPTK